MTEVELVRIIEKVVDERLSRVRRVDDKGEYLTQTAAAKYADCSPSTIRSWCDAGKLRRHHNGRVKRSALDRFLATGLSEVEEAEVEQATSSNVVDAKAFAAKVLAQRSGK